MAFLQTDFPPSTAPVHVRRPAVAPVRRPLFTLTPRRRFGAGRAVGLAVLAAAVAIPGYATAVATESLALGVLAADFAFLLAIAAWSTVSAR